MNAEVIVAIVVAGVGWIGSLLALTWYLGSRFSKQDEQLKNMPDIKKKLGELSDYTLKQNGRVTALELRLGDHLQLVKHG